MALGVEDGGRRVQGEIVCEVKRWCAREDKEASAVEGDGDGDGARRETPSLWCFSFYSILRGPLPTRVRRWSCLGGSLHISCGSG